MTAEHPLVKIQSFFLPSRPHGVGNRLFGEVERRRIRGKPQTRALDQADELFTNQVMPEPTFRRGR